MVEVFKTNVEKKGHARMLIVQIEKTFCNYIANFDLDDCDNILPIKSKSGLIQSSCLINLLKEFGFHSEVLPDLPYPVGKVVLPETIF